MIALLFVPVRTMQKGYEKDMKNLSNNQEQFKLKITSGSSCQGKGGE
jgi:hypothetical protein